MPEATVIQAYYSAVLDHPIETVWSLIRDFNNYPAYIDGVSESVIEDDKRGDEVGAVRRFCYLGNWVRQRLAGHSDAKRSLTYSGNRTASVSAGPPAGITVACALRRRHAAARDHRGRPHPDRMGRHPRYIAAGR